MGTARIGVASFVLAGLTGCGEVSERPPDAGQVERGPATVTVYGPTGPVQGANVLFYDELGAVTAMLLSDGAGHASAEVSPGASVAVVQARTGLSEVSIILAIAPGDQLAIGAPPVVRDSSGDGFFVTLPERTLGRIYRASTRCGNGFGVSYAMVPVGRSFPCTGPFTINAIAEGAGAGGSTVPIGQLVSTGHVLVGTPMEVVTAAGTWAPIDPLAVSYSSIPGGVTRGELSVVSLDAGVEQWTSGALFTVTGAAQAINHAHPQFGDTTSYATWLGKADGTLPQVVYERSAPASSYGLAAAPALLPWISAGSFDVATSTAHWLATGDGAVDAAEIRIDYQRTGLAVTYRVVAPAVAGTTSAVVPVLPASVVGDLAPTAADTVYVAPRLIRYGDGAGYPAARARWLGDQAVIRAGRVDLPRVTVSGDPFPTELAPP
ncbi:MAG: hypothetical protein KBG28_30460 [Kofleriaceae bacterium]|nr:hypothetical protein [Kofleriaceae bacterium]MBP6840314.1 hypothetical protein [Kofleriaceae bacterium]MBP9208332.1 hypothetical protein [Kofleriaceae bacterium]